MKDEKRNMASAALDEFADAVAEVLHRRSYKEIVTFKEIADYAIAEREKNRNISSFVISVKKNPDPQSENDQYVVIQGFLDNNNKPITLNGKEAESRIMHAKTIDRKFVDVLNGAETRIIKL